MEPDDPFGGARPQKQGDQYSPPPARAGGGPRPLGSPLGSGRPPSERAARDGQADVASADAYVDGVAGSPACWQRRHTCDAVSGVRVTRTPSGRSASSTALARTGGGASVPPSPRPFTPSGF